MAVWLWTLIGLAIGIAAASAVAVAYVRPRVRKLYAKVADLEYAAANADKALEFAKAQADLNARQAAVDQRERSEQDLRQRAALLDEEHAKRLATLTRLEEKLVARDDGLEARRAALDAREQDLLVEGKSIQERAEHLRLREESVESELQRIGKLTRDQAKVEILKRAEIEFAEIARRKAAEVEAGILADVEQKAKRTLVDVMQRTAAEVVSSATVALVELPSEDMKGRIIGRDGRNIRAFEQVTGVDLIVDETPEAVVISCFDPVRRETARLTLMNLMLDGRIHPAKIEELFAKATEEVERTIRDAGERAATSANVGGLSPAVVQQLGRLRFRTSYAQNVLDHSVEVSKLCGMLASEVGANVEIAKRAGLLHDIGKGLSAEWEGPHAITGMEFLRSVGEREPVLHAVGAHHYEIEPESAEAILVIIADTISASRPGARRESLENYIKRLTTLEALANSFDGVERSFALQAGREIRLIVKPGQVDDLGAKRLADAVARRIEAELEYPGQIKVTVIRETRATDTAH